ncbi:MAG: AMP-binding protein [Candidatus Acidiferrales bacterium]
MRGSLRKAKEAVRRTQGAETARETHRTVATPSSQLDSLTTRERILAVIRGLVAELGNTAAMEEFAHKGVRAHFERDLGLGSLERVELLLRAGDACGLRLPDAVVAESETVQDLLDAIARHEGADSELPHFLSAQAARVRPAPERELREMPEADLDSVESLTEVLRRRARAIPERTHIFLYEEESNPRQITFGQLYERARAAAWELIQRGISPGETVAIMLPTCAEFFFSFFGVQMAGGIPVPIYPPFRAGGIEEYAERQTGILRNAESVFLITWRSAEGVARLLAPRVPSLREVLNAQRLAESAGPPPPPESEARPADPISHRPRGSDIAFLQYTSGSTGTPKGVVLTHANLLANLRAIGEAVKPTPEDVVVSWLPLYHDMGLIGAWLVPLCYGLPLVSMSPLAFLSRPERWLQAISRHRGTLTAAPNFAYELCVRRVKDEDLRVLDLSSMRAALNGAEPVRAETLERFTERFAPCGFRREALLPVYGLAEATLGVSTPQLGTGARVDSIDRATYEREGRAIPAESGAASVLRFVSAGHPLPGVEVRLIDTSGNDAADRVEGQLWFRSPAATSGYHRNPEASQEILRGDGWLDSGDLAYLADGELYITGRAKDIIIKAGRNLCPQDVEDIVTHVKGVRAGCIVAFGISDERSGTEQLVIAAEIRDLRQRAEIAAEINREISLKLGLPPDVVVLLAPQSIPKTSSGKLRRSETKRMYLAGRLGKTQSPAWMQITRMGLRALPVRAAEVSGRIWKRFWRYIYGLYVMSVVSVSMLCLWLIVCLTPNSAAAARITRIFARSTLIATGLFIRVVNGELLSDWKHSGPWIFAPNHSSYVDILVTLALLPAGVRFVAKGEAVDMPLFGTILRRCGHLCFDRESLEARVRHVAEMEAALRHGESLAIYPEGTFTAAAGIRPFQLGAFKAAVTTNSPVCPVAVAGARKILPDKTYLPRPGRIRVTFGPLLHPQEAVGDWHEMVRLRDAARQAIAEGTGEALL